MGTFEQEWREHYGAAEPVGPTLIEPFVQTWLRVHSLPESKRYPESDTEWAILLQRQAVVAAAVLGAGEACWEVVFRPAGTRRDLIETYRFRDDAGIYGAEHLDWAVSAAPTVWNFERAEPLLRRIADDTAGERVLWMARRDGAVFAPYDGGVDLFFTKPERRDAVAAKYADWLSPRSDGL